MTKEEEKKPTLWQVICSVLGAMFGVQSQKSRERDFQYGSPIAFIIVGVMAVTLFVLLILGIVKLVTLDSHKKHNVTVHGDLHGDL